MTIHHSLDSSTSVRPGEELNNVALANFLHGALGLDGSLHIEQFPRGYSNLTYLLRMGGRELVLRRPPFGANIKGGHDMGREYAVLTRLRPVYGKAPRPLAYCHDENVLGAPFYVMERVQGVILRSQMPPAMQPAPDLMARIAAAFVENLAALHAVDVSAAGLGELGRPEGYVRRQIEGWSRRYRSAQTDDIADIEDVVAWLAQHMPAESGAALIHNDYKYDNVILSPDDWSQIAAVLDWEMATMGDPLMDLGSSLGYWVQPDDPEVLRKHAFGPTMLPGNPSRGQLVEMYEAASGRSVDHPVFYYVYGLFKLAVIVQQIYARFKAGRTDDLRFASLIEVVHACGRAAVTTLERDHL